MAIFIVLTGGIGLAKFHHPVELLPVIGTIVSTWALFRCKRAHHALRDVVFNVLLGDSQLLGGVDRRHND